MSTFFSELWGAIDGKKTYIVSGVIIAYALVVVGWMNHDWSTAGQMVLGALGLGSVRHALEKK